MKRLSLVALAAALFAVACSAESAPATTATSVPVTTVQTTVTTVPATTTLATTTTTTVAPTSSPLVGGTIGIVGCSNSAMAAAGYDVLSDLDLLTQGGLTGGSVGVWGNEGPGRYDRYWGIYDERRPAEGYSAVWFQLCLRTTEHGGVFNDSIKEWMEHIVADIHERDPGIPIWVSGVNTFEDGHLCRILGEDGAAIAAEAADWLAAETAGVDRGPDLGPVLAEHLDPGEDCHPNTEGQAVLGQQLVDFFDG